MNIKLSFLLLLGMFLVFPFLISCSSVNLANSYAESYTIEQTHETQLGKKAQSLMAKSDANASGFYPSVDGIESLAIRLALIEMAEKSIDLQYYLIKDDSVGKLFVASLVKAAERGVRVRVLLDDIFTKGYDVGMLALDSHPNMEIRLFNPFAYRNVRTANLLNGLQLNRRMHNKTFIVDNQFSIVGGRNMAAEYFGAREDLNFSDVDLLVVGPVVSDVSTMFDQYWNSKPSVPVSAVVNAKNVDPETRLNEFRKRIGEEFDKAKKTAYGKALVSDASALTERLTDKLIWSTNYQLVYDAPAKGLRGQAAEAASIVTPLAAALEESERSLLIVSPYFVPLNSGVEVIESLQDRGVDVTVVTNSLASNNHTLVHAGYAPYRKPVLKAGAKIYEAKNDFKLDELERLGVGDSSATLHAKFFVVDEDIIFVGSFNFDPRSVNLNTESGLVVYSKALADVALLNLQGNLDANTWEVVLDSRKKLQWIDRSQPEIVTYDKEPNSTWWRRFKVGFMRMLPIRSQL